MIRNHPIWAVCFAGALALSACGDIDDGNGSGGQPDAAAGIDAVIDLPDARTGQPDARTGLPDAGQNQPDAQTGQPDARTGQPDAQTGLPDAAGLPDAQVSQPDAGPPTCPIGEEGCGCTASTDETNAPDEHVQDDCDPGLICVPWDAFSRSRGLTELEAPVDSLSSCVRPCIEDADCGTGRSCSFARWIIADANGAIVQEPVGMCVDSVAGPEEFCSLSKLENSVVSLDLLPEDNPDGIPDTPLDVQIPGEMVGCGEGFACGVTFFGDLHGQEGACVQYCSDDTDCDANGDPNYDSCTLNFGPTFGFCGAEVKELGDQCGQESPNPNADVTISTSCAERGPNVGCFGIPNENRRGACLELCTLTIPCQGTDNGGVGIECIPDPANPGQNGICRSECNPLENDCAAGTTCTNLGLITFANADPEDLNLNMCYDVETPSLAPAEFDDNGAVTSTGDDCNPAGTQRFDWLQCPTGSSCFPQNAPNPGLCIPLCDTNSATADAYCETVNGAGSVCGSLATSGFTEGEGACSTP